MAIVLVLAIGYNSRAMPKPHPPQWAPPRPGRSWSYEVLRKKVEEFNAEWTKTGRGGIPIWEFSINRGFQGENGSPERQVLTETEFFGDNAREPIPGRYYAETVVEGERIEFEGVHYDKDQRAERHARGESEGEAVRRAVSDQFTRYEHEVARLRREKDQRDDRDAKRDREMQGLVDALREKDAENLAMQRERDAALNERDEAVLKAEAALEEKRQLVEDNEQLREPIRMLGAAIVENAMDYFGVDLEGGEGLSDAAKPAAVRAAGELIIMAVLRCPEAQEVLRLAVDEDTGEPLMPVIQEPDIDPIDFVISYLQEVARAQAEGAGQGTQAYTNGSTRGHEHEAAEAEGVEDAEGGSP